MATVKKEIKNRSYALAKEVDPNQKCPPQAQLILNILKEAGGKMTRDALLTALKRPPDQGGLTTTQSAERILGFYKPKLIELQAMTEIVDVTSIDIEVPDKPAPAEKPAKAPKTAAASAGEKGVGKKGVEKSAA